MFRRLISIILPIDVELFPACFTIGEGDDAVIRIRPLVDPRPPKPKDVDE